MYNVAKLIDKSGACLVSDRLEDYVFSCFPEHENGELFGLFHALETALAYIKIVNQVLASKNLPVLYASGAIIYDDTFKEFPGKDVYNISFRVEYAEEELCKLLNDSKIYSDAIFFTKDIFTHYYKNANNIVNLPYRKFEDTDYYVYAAGAGAFKNKF